MQYKVEPIGTEFSNKALADFERLLNARAAEGYKFHSVFQVKQTGCLGRSEAKTVYLAIYIKE